VVVVDVDVDVVCRRPANIFAPTLVRGWILARSSKFESS
jgi:hypothetical protein